MLDIVMTASFRRDLRRCIRRGLPRQELEHVVSAIAAGQALPSERLDHPLSGDFAGFRECHVRPDWLLIYRIDHGVLALVLTRTGTHADLFVR